MTLPLDYARCAGAGWEECADCQRRTAPPGPNQIAPPAIVMFECENYISPDGLVVQRLQGLARQIDKTATTLKP